MVMVAGLVCLSKPFKLINGHLCHVLELALNEKKKEKKKIEISLKKYKKSAWKKERKKKERVKRYSIDIIG